MLEKKLITRHPMITRFFRRGRPVMIPAFSRMRVTRSKRSFSHNKREEPDFTFEEEGLIFTRRSRSAQQRIRRQAGDIRSNIEELYLSHKHHYFMKAMIKESLARPRHSTREQNALNPNNDCLKFKRLHPGDFEEMFFRDFAG